MSLLQICNIFHIKWSLDEREDDLSKNHSKRAASLPTSDVSLCFVLKALP